MNQKTINMYELMAQMEMNWQELHNLQCGKSFEEIEQKVEDFKIRLKKQYKLMVKKYHPDVNPSVNPDCIKQVNNAYEILSQIKVVPKPKPIQQNVIIRYNYSSNGEHTYTSTSTTFSTGGFWYY